MNFGLILTDMNQSISKCVLITPIRKFLKEDEAESCGGGLHFSIANYFREYEPSSFTTLYAEIDVDDIITVCKDKIRCRKAKIIGICDDEI